MNTTYAQTNISKALLTVVQLNIRNSIKHHVCKQFRTQQMQATNVSMENWSGPLTISADNSLQRRTIKEEQYSALSAH